MLPRLVDRHGESGGTGSNRMAGDPEGSHRRDVDEFVIEGDHIDLGRERQQHGGIPGVADPAPGHHPQRRIVGVGGQHTDVEVHAQRRLEHHQGQLPRSDDPDDRTLHAGYFIRSLFRVSRFVI